MKVLIATIGIGGQYPRLVARMIERFHNNSPGYELRAWVNTLPPGALGSVIVDGYDYGPYCAKPFAMRALREAGADVGILLDAAFWPIRDIHPLVAHIQQHGCYFCENGFPFGQWCSDAALARFRVDREQAFQIEEISSYCVGLDFGRNDANWLLNEWCRLANDGVTFPGPHTNINAARTIGDRNRGFVSTDPRVMGHRHDQTALSILAHWAGMGPLVKRPMLTTYHGQESKDTVLVNWGRIIE